MRYTAKQYAKALFEALKGKSKEDQKKAIRTFLQLLVRNKDYRLLAAIIKEFERWHLKEMRMRKVSLESASKVGEDIKKEIRTILGENIVFEEHVNPGILAGIKILIDEELLIDASGKRFIQKLFFS